MKANKKNFKEIKPGDFVSFGRTVTEDDLLKFAELSGDQSPLHVDAKYAEGTKFKQRIIHGMFLGALVSRLVGMELLEENVLCVKETLEFKKPALVGDELTVKGTVVHKSEALLLLELSLEISTKKELLASGSIYVRVLP
jgi:3-oxoacyl-[acyl-carrier protein] reductase